MSARDDTEALWALISELGGVKSSESPPVAVPASPGQIIHVLQREVLRLRAEVARLTPVVEAAKAWRAGRTEFGEFNGDFGGDDALVAAVDALAPVGLGGTQ